MYASTFLPPVLTALVWVEASGVAAYAAAAATVSGLALAFAHRMAAGTSIPPGELDPPSSREPATDTPTAPAPQPAVVSLVRAFETDLAPVVSDLQNAAAGILHDIDRLGVFGARATAQVITVSVASEDTSRRAESVARAVQELSQAIDEVGSKAAHSSSLAATLAAEAVQADATMAELAEATATINAITDVIAAIARQTNLLALNAAIEAARSGAAGRGFAVVAQEVKELAGQTSGATQEIGAQLALMQTIAGRCVAANRSIAARIRELEGVVAIINGSVEEQAAATRCIADDIAIAATGVAHVEHSMEEIDTLADTNTRAVAELSVAAQNLADRARTLEQRTRGIADEVERLCA